MLLYAAAVSAVENSGIDKREKLLLDSAQEGIELKELMPYSKVIVAQGRDFVHLVPTGIAKFGSENAYYERTAKLFRSLLANYLVQTSKPSVCLTLLPAEADTFPAAAMCLKRAEIIKFQAARTLAMDENIKQAGPFFRQLLGTASMREVISTTTLKATNDVATTRFLSQIPKMSLGIADAFEQNAMNPKSANNQQRSGDYELITQGTRLGEIVTWSARCVDGADVVVSKRDSASSVCFYRNNNAARCESIGVEAAVRKACAE